MATARARLTRERAGLLQASAGSYRTADNVRNGTQRIMGGSGDTHADDRSRQLIRELTRQMERNAHTFAVLIGRWLDDLGTPMPRFRSSDAEWNAKMSKRWAQRASLRTGGWDSRQMATWGELFRLVAGSVARDGDIAAVKVADGTLALVEADCIAGGQRASNQYQRTVGGVTLNTVGKPLQMWICPRNPGGYPDIASAKAYPWNQVGFCANRTRATQTRGLPPLVAGLDDFERGDSLLESTVIQAEQAASVYGVIKRVRQELARGAGAGALAPQTINGNATPVDTGAATDDQTPDYVATARGALLMLYDDQEFNQVENKNPNLSVPPFMQFLLRLHSLGLSYPYEIAFMDMGPLSWSAGKTLITLAREGMRRWREQVFEPFLTDIALWDTQRAIIADGGRAPDDWNAIEWDWPELPWPDPLKEEQTTKLALENRTTSLRRVTRHWDAIMRERSEEERLQDSLAISRIAAAQALCNDENDKVPGLNLHWSHIVTLVGAGTSPGAYIQGAAAVNGGASAADPAKTPKGGDGAAPKADDGDGADDEDAADDAGDD